MENRLKTYTMLGIMWTDPRSCVWAGAIYCLQGLADWFIFKSVCVRARVHACVLARAPVLVHTWMTSNPSGVLVTGGCDSH